MFVYECNTYVDNTENTGTEFEWSMLTEVFQFFKVAITITIVAVPEGLPMVINIK
jgi:magnesium-transporting ATPase (P-type)